MTRTATSPRRPSAPGPAPTRTRPDDGPVDGALDDALDHIGRLSERLWAVRRLHRPVRTRSLLGAERVSCAECGQVSPCPTLVAVRPS